jgi:hypothetical protein
MVDAMTEEYIFLVDVVITDEYISRRTRARLSMVDKSLLDLWNRRCFCGGNLNIEYLDQFLVSIWCDDCAYGKEQMMIHEGPFVTVFQEKEEP